MAKKKVHDLLDQIDAWLDAHSEVFNEIREDWESFDMIKPVDNIQQDFKCNDCGKCCKFSPEIFPSDIICWLDEKRYDLICSVFPFMGEGNKFSYGLPTQDEFQDNINQILNHSGISQKEITAYKRIKDVVKALNPGFNESSEYCIFYNPNVEHHCMIYDTRPFSCQVYPYDLPNFSRIQIADELSSKYGLENVEEPSEKENKEDPDKIPMCPASCFSKNDKLLPTKCSEDDLYAVLLDKVNFLAYSVMEEDIEYDIISLFIEAFSSQIKFPKGHTSSSKKAKTSPTKTPLKDKGGKASSNRAKNKSGSKKQTDKKDMVKMTFGPKDWSKK